MKKGWKAEWTFRRPRIEKLQTLCLPGLSRNERFEAEIDWGGISTYLLTHLNNHWPVRKQMQAMSMGNECQSNPNEAQILEYIRDVDHTSYVPQRTVPGASQDLVPNMAFPNRSNLNWLGFLPSTFGPDFFRSSEMLTPPVFLRCGWGGHGVGASFDPRAAG